MKLQMKLLLTLTTALSIFSTSCSDIFSTSDELEQFQRKQSHIANDSIALFSFTTNWEDTKCVGGFFSLCLDTIATYYYVGYRSDPSNPMKLDESTHLSSNFFDNYDGSSIAFANDFELVSVEPDHRFNNAGHMVSILNMKTGVIDTGRYFFNRSSYINDVFPHKDPNYINVRFSNNTQHNNNSSNTFYSCNIRTFEVTEIKRPSKLDSGTTKSFNHSIYMEESTVEVYKEGRPIFTIPIDDSFYPIIENPGF
jgi:hypothetical protein